MTLPDTMTALVLREDGYASGSAGDMPTDLSEFVSLTPVPVPQPREGQALIKVRRAAVNPSDLMFVSGQYGQPRKAGMPAGFEGVGEVVAGDTPLLGQRVSGEVARCVQCHDPHSINAIFLAGDDHSIRHGRLLLGSGLW